MAAQTAIVLLSIIASILPLHAEDLSPAEDAILSQNFIESQRSIRTYRATFEQSVSLLGLRNPSVSKGTFLYRAPHDLRIEYSQPAGDFFLLLGNDFYVARDEKPVQKRPASDRSARILVALRKVMNGHSDAGTKMTRKVRRDGTEFVITLTPETPDADVPEKIENRIDGHSLFLKEMTISLPRGTRMQFRFSEPKCNAEVDMSLFAAP